MSLGSADHKAKRRTATGQKKIEKAGSNPAKRSSKVGLNKTSARSRTPSKRRRGY